MVVEDCRVLGDMTDDDMVISILVHHYGCRRLPGTWRHNR